jgi:hypothetical protein
MSASREYRKRSYVYEYFEYRNGHKATCKICKTDVKAPTGNTSNLRSHLNLKHNREYNDLIAKEELSKNTCNKNSLKVIM